MRPDKCVLGNLFRILRVAQQAWFTIEKIRSQYRATISSKAEAPPPESVHEHPVQGHFLSFGQTFGLPCSDGRIFELFPKH